MRKFIITAVALAALTACAPKPTGPAAPEAPALSPTLGTDAPAGAYHLDPTHASLTWKVMHMGLAKYTARFAKFDAQLNFDPADPSKNSVTATIDPLSVRTDYPFAKVAPPWGGAKEDFDAKIATDPKFLNGKKFKEITFKSTSVERTGEKTAKITGDLTLLGVTKPVTLEATFNGGTAAHMFTKAGAVGFSATGTLKRSEFGFSEGIPVVGDDVELLIEAEFQQTPPAAATPAK